MTTIQLTIEVAAALLDQLNVDQIFVRVRQHEAAQGAHQDPLPDPGVPIDASAREVEPNPDDTAPDDAAPDNPSGVPDSLPYGISTDEGTYRRNEGPYDLGDLASLGTTAGWWQPAPIGNQPPLPPNKIEQHSNGAYSLHFSYEVQASDLSMEVVEPEPFHMWEEHEALRHSHEAAIIGRQLSARHRENMGAFSAMGNTISPMVALSRNPNPMGRLRRTIDAVTAQRRRQVVCFEILDGTYPIAHKVVGLPDDPRAEPERIELSNVLDQPWALGTNTVAHIPRVISHATQQPYTPMINWEVDTLRTWVLGVGAGRVRASFGWDIVFGRAAQRGPAHPRPFALTAASAQADPAAQAFARKAVGTRRTRTDLTALGSELRRFHNADKLASARNPDGWIPWVLAYAESVGIPFGRIVGTVGHAAPVAFTNLRSMQDNANESWRRRGLLGPTTPPTAAQHPPRPSATQRWNLSDDALLDAILNGMCPHAPSVVPVDPSDPEGPARLVWTFTWTGEDGRPRYPQDGIFDVDADPEICEAARMPDIRVQTTAAPQATTDIGPALTAPVKLHSIGLRFPFGTDAEPEADSFEWFEAPDSDDTPIPPGPEAFTTGWAYAKWFVRQAILVAGQIDWHLARCHVYMEQMCAVLCTHLRRRPIHPGTPGDHPLLAALWPFIRSADEINAFGDLTLLSADGVLSKACSLDHSAAMHRLRRQRADWRWNTSPVRRPATAHDHFAEWSRTAWDACGEWAQALPPSTFEALGKGETLGDRVRESLARVDAGHMGDETWYPWWGTAGDLPTDTGTVHLAARPTDGDLALPETPDQWRQLATHLLYSATFLHSWVGGRQFSDMGNVWVASAGHRWDSSPLGPGESGSAADAEAEFQNMGPLPAHAGFIVSLSELIGENDWGRFQHLEHEVEVADQADGATALRAQYRSTAAAHAAAGTLSAEALERLPVDRVRTRVCI